MAIGFLNYIERQAALIVRLVDLIIKTLTH